MVFSLVRMLRPHVFSFNKNLLGISTTAIMKRESNHSSRKSIKKEKFKTISPYIDISAIGHGFAGTPKCVIVNTSHCKYMFNCGEGTQRIGTEHKKIRGTDKIFFTSGKWENVGGLIGMSLTLETAAIPKLHLYGPCGFINHVDSSRSFSKFEKIQLVKEDMSKSFTDLNMTINFIKIKKEKEQLENEAKRMKMSESSDEISDCDAVAYLCKPHAKPRNIDLEKCVQLNVPAGPHLALLKEEKEVVLPGTDRVIKPDDILSPKEPNDPFLIVECPSVDHLHNFTSSPDLLNLQGEGSNICLIIHFTESSIMANPVYVDWMKRFGPNTHHLVLNNLCSPVDAEAMHRIQAPRNLVHPIIFPLLPHSLHPEDEFINTKDQIAFGDKDKNLVRYARTNTKFIYRPFTQSPFDEEQCLSLDPARYINEALSESAKTFMEKWKPKYQNLQRKKATLEDPEVVFLGTGSAVPNKYRNVSCIMLNVGEDASFMMDCGENSCGQLYRLYGMEEGRRRLKNLKAVFISHLHADHHLGLVGLAIERKKCFEGEEMEPLLVVASEALSRWYSSITCDNIPINRLVNLIPAECLYSDDLQKPETYNKLLSLFDFEMVQTVRVQHSQYPHGVILKHNKGWKIVYSGDTMPCENLIEAGKNCDLLIHEATFDANKVHEAREKKHSTCDQAIDVGRSMKAKFIMLTHFSQRYDKLPLFSKKFSSDVGVAFDTMMVKMSDLSQLPSFVEAYKVIYETEYEEMLQVIENKQHRLELAKSLM